MSKEVVLPIPPRQQFTWHLTYSYAFQKQNKTAKEHLPRLNKFAIIKIFLTPDSPNYRLEMGWQERKREEAENKKGAKENKSSEEQRRGEEGEIWSRLWGTLGVSDSTDRFLTRQCFSCLHVSHCCHQFLWVKNLPSLTPIYIHRTTIIGAVDSTLHFSQNHGPFPMPALSHPKMHGLSSQLAIYLLA